MPDFNQPGRILVTCAKAMPPWLCGELRTLEFPVIRELEAGVETRGSLSDAMRLNLHLRTAHRVLFMVHEGEALDADQLYQALSVLPWEQYLPSTGHLCINTAVENPTIRDTRFAALKCKDAIVDRLRAKTGQRPDTGGDQGGAVVFLYWRGRSFAIYLDTSGEPLSKRGYRKIPWKAPMQETLAAGVMLATGWGGDDNLVNPMCGSGTLAIEAALIALNRAPGLLRSGFGIQHLAGFDPAAWQAARTAARATGRKRIGGKIVASDIDARAIAAAKLNARTAGVDHLIQFEVCDFTKTPVPAGSGAVIFNPEYGERLGEEDKLTSIYFGIGDFLKQKCQGYRGYVFTGNLTLAKRIGLRSSRRVPFYNSRIECRLLEFEMYSGSRKQSEKE